MMFHDWTGSLAILLVIVTIVAAFAIFVTALATWIWGKEPGAEETPPVHEPAHPPLREAA
jgi:hypothetical protein